MRRLDVGFADRAQLHAKGGDGGNGAVSFRREPFHPLGGPDGGDGGKGGDVYVVGDASRWSLREFLTNPYRRAGDGGHGSSNNKRGRRGQDLMVPVPLGTVVRARDGTEVAVLTQPGQRVLVARGGKGGYGNAHFKSSRWRAPRLAERGEKGEDVWYDLELRMLAEVGLVGLPNVGKSSVLSRLTRASPKVADYAFTTLEPQLGTVVVDAAGEERSFRVADIPGLIEGAHLGKGLGNEFLRHVALCRVLVLVLDGAGLIGVSPDRQLEVLLEELSLWDRALLDRPRVVAANKADLFDGVPEAVLRVVEPGTPVVRTSCVTGEGISDLVKAIVEVLPAPAGPALDRASYRLHRPRGRGLQVEQEGKGKFRVKGPFAERVERFTYTSQEEVVRYVEHVLRRQGIDRLMRRAGAVPGDVVLVGPLELVWLGPRGKRARYLRSEPAEALQGRGGPQTSGETC